jgi:chaperone required for assembly of F1-ATPase
MIPPNTPARNSFKVPTKALEAAIAKEWEGRKGFNAVAMPLTSIAFTAIDRTEPERDNAVEILLAYVDTDTLCYRAAASEKLSRLQHEQWDTIVAWSGKQLGCIWQTTSGVMPIEQSETLHQAVRTYLQPLDSMRLTACTVLASLYSSLILAMAVMEGRLAAEAAFDLSRLEEAHQREEWGEDEEASGRTERIRAEIASTARFLSLLKEA